VEERKGIAVAGVDRRPQDPLKGVEVALLCSGDEPLFRIALHKLTLNTGAVGQKCFTLLV
jgi:hypothetical protein